MRAYFAYGSNLCFPRFVSRVPSARFVTVAKLPGFRVVFHKRSDDSSGKATILPDSGCSVYGALYEFEDGDRDALRRAEGYPKHYEERERTTVYTLDGERDAMTYVATAAFYDSTQIPYDWYVDLIRCGARRLGLPEDYVAQFDIVASKRDLDRSRVAKERAFLR